MQNLPGLNGDFIGYPEAHNNSERYQVIPFSDWLPPDFETVPCSRGGAYMPMWYSPIKNIMFFDDGGEGVKPSELATWLRKI